MTAGSIVTSSAAVLSTGPSLGQGVPGNSQYGAKALLFDMFGTVLDWRTGVARSVEATLKPRGYDLDCPHLDPIERLWGLMHRNVTHNRC